MDVVIAACAVGDGDPYFDAGDAAAIVQLIFFEFGWDCLCLVFAELGPSFWIALSYLSRIFGFRTLFFASPLDRKSVV